MSGAEQSPITITTTDAIKTDRGALALSCTAVTCAPHDSLGGDGPRFCAPEGRDMSFAHGCKLEIDGVTYALVECHPHRPAEHIVDGVQHEMEIHLVFEAKDPPKHKGRLAVIGVLIKTGDANQHLDPILRGSSATINPRALLPTDPSAYYRYAGSLTTSPYSEIVTWSVLKQPVTASPDQLNAYVELMPKGNARPVQPTNRRFVLLSES